MDTSFKPIIVHHKAVGVDCFQATGDEGDLVTMALVDFGFLLQPPDLKTHRYSFDQLADQIEANFSLDNPRTAAVVEALRVVQNRNT